MATPTGFDWDANWATLINAVTLTQGGTLTSLSGAVSNDVKVGTEVSVDADYSNHPKATAGLKVEIWRDVNGTDYQATVDLPFSVELVFTQAGTNRTVFTVPAEVSNFKVNLVWGNTTASSAVTVTVSTRQVNIPAAVA